MAPRTLTTLLLTLGLTFGSFSIMVPDAAAQPGSILAKSREKGERTHKGRATSSKGTSKSTSKSTKKGTSNAKSSRSSSNSASNRRVVRTTTTRSAPTRTNVQSRRTVTTRTRPAGHTTTTTRTVRNVRPRTTTHRHSTHSHSRTYVSSRSHHHHHGHTSSRTYVSSSARSGRSHGRATVEPYVTGGLGISGLAVDAVVDGAMPGVGYNLAIGAKGKLFGGELGLNGGGYTLSPGTMSTDIGLIGISGDLKLQPSIAFFEPYVAVGLGGYALQDGVINETSGGVGFRLGAGADFRFDNVALRLGYQFGAYGMGNDTGAYGTDSFGAKSETLSGSLVVYF